MGPETFLTATRASHPIPSADGSLIFGSDMAGLPQVYRMESPAAWPLRLASSANRTIAVGETADGLLVRHDRGGDEVWQVGLAGRAGDLRILTRDARAMHQGVTIAPDGRRAGLAYNPGGQVDMVLGVLDLSSGDIEPWADLGGLWHWEAWRPDGAQAAAVKTLGGRRTEACLIAPSAQPIRILEAAPTVPDVAWVPSGRVFAITNFDSEFAGLAEIDPARPDAPLRWVLKPEREVEAYVPDPSGRRAVVALNHGAYDQLVVIDLDSGRQMTEIDLPPGVLYRDNASDLPSQMRWTPDGSSLFLAWETPVQGADVYELVDGTATRWTLAGSSLPGTLRPVETSYRSFDGLEIPALHFKHGEEARPTVIWFHGGPESQFRGNFSPVIQLLLASGLNVFAPNVRGSAGYGVHFLSLDDRELRWDSVRDGCEAARHLKREKLATKTAAMGASYGGFMTLAVLVEDPELWDAAVDLVGIADWQSFFKNTSGWRRAARMSEYGDPEGAQREVLAEFSPLRRAHTIKAPLLVLHGRNDPRVPVEEAQQISEATGAELMIFEDEGHGIVRHANRVRAYSRALEFFKEKLLDSTA